MCLTEKHFKNKTKNVTLKSKRFPLIFSYMDYIYVDSYFFKIVIIIPNTNYLRFGIKENNHDFNIACVTKLERYKDGD